MTAEAQIPQQPPAAAPNLSIRTKPPSPKRLSRKVLLAGALCAGAVTAYAVLAGLSDQNHHAAARSAESAAATATPPETIAQASSDYDPRTLQAPHDPVWGDHPPLNTQNTELQAPTDPNFANTAPAQPASGQGSAAAAAPDPQHTAYVSPILFPEHGATRGQATMSAPNAGVSEGGVHGGFIASQRGASADRLEATIEPPHSRYQLQAGAVIPAALLTELNSDLPGRVIAQVTAPVYDSVTGSEVLIPQGARLIGAYDGAATHGDNRILLAWNRIVFPNGWSIDLQGMEATDPSGAAGLRDRVDNHIGPLAGAIGLSTLFSVLANNAENDHNDRNLAQTVGDAVAQQAAETGGRIVDRDLQVHPTLRVRVGAPVRVLVTRDISLRPYQR
ncbi:MAG: TrbI/VirB10 family protein [Pseudomonadota bacterium]